MPGFPISIPFLEDLGVVCRQLDADGAVVELDLLDRHYNSLAVAHGGVIMTLLDVAQAMAARGADPDGRTVVTVEMKTAFMRPAKGTLRATGRCLHRSMTMAFCEAEIADTYGRLFAKASGTFKYVRQQPQG